jgi:serine/threonine protein kinase
MLLKMRRSARFAPTVFSGANSMETRQSTHPSPRQLAALALGKLAPEARDRLQAHVSACAACTTFLAQTPPETLQSLLQQSTAPRNAAEQSTPSAQRPQATNPAASLLRAKPLAAAPSRQAPPNIADDSIPRELREQTKYRIVRLLGRGGMGSVYEVHHERMDRRQALKVINPELVDNPQALLRFEQELKAVAKLDHPNIARAYDAESFGSLQAIVMEFVAGQTLHEMLKKRGRFAVKDACRCVRQACLGLQHAHERGLVHRDLKPQNLMLTQDSGVIKILDFGLAKVVSENKGAQGLTKTNMTMGTYEYSAPEQAIDAASADIRADIYSLGCTLYYLLAGVLPFDYNSDAKLLLAHQNEVPRPLVEVCPETPQELSDLVARMLAKSPADRPQTPGEVAKALLLFAKGEIVSPLPAEEGLGAIASPRPYSGEGQGVRATEPAIDPSLAEMIADARQGTRHSGPKIKKRPLSPRRSAKWLPKSPRDRFLVATAAAALFAVLLCGVLFTMRTPDGTLVIESDDPNVQVAVKQGGQVVEVVDARSGWKLSLKSGQYELAPQGSTDQFQLDRDSVTVRRGDVVKVKLTLKRPSSPLPPGEGQGARVAEIPNSKSQISNHYCPVISRIVSTGYDKHLPDLGQKSWKVPEK